MRKFRGWLYSHFLPNWAKEELLEENARLREHASALERENERLRAYISGLESGVKSQRRIVIHTGEVRK